MRGVPEDVVERGKYKGIYDKIKHERRVFNGGVAMKRIPWVLIIFEARPKLFAVADASGYPL
jgi:hypothetical protein